jgi:hypothetical protein
MYINSVHVGLSDTFGQSLVIDIYGTGILSTVKEGTGNSKFGGKDQTKSSF